MKNNAFRAKALLFSVLALGFSLSIGSARAVVGTKAADETATLEYTTTATSNMVASENSAERVNLNPNIFNVEAVKNKPNNNVGLNQAHNIRLYGDKSTGDGNELVVTIAEDFEIHKVSVSFGLSTNNVTAVFKVDDVVVDELDNPRSETKEYANLEAKSFSLKNTHETAGSVGQVFILSIAIEYESLVEEVLPASVTLDKEAVTIKKFASTKLTATVLPAETLYKEVDWASSDENVAVVDDEGNVVGIKGGTATIQATTKVGELRASAVVTVDDSAVAYLEHAKTFTGFESNYNPQTLTDRFGHVWSVNVGQLDSNSKFYLGTNANQIEKAVATGAYSSFAAILADSEFEYIAVMKLANVLIENITDLTVAWEDILGAGEVGLAFSRDEGETYVSVATDEISANGAVVWEGEEEAVHIAAYVLFNAAANIRNVSFALEAEKFIVNDYVEPDDPENGNGNGDPTSEDPGTSVPPVSEPPVSEPPASDGEPPVSEGETPSTSTPTSEESSKGCRGSLEATLIVSALLVGLVSVLAYKRRRLKA